MTNLTKAIAALGVVAGLGVAALPLTSYAETTPVKWQAGNEDNSNTTLNYGGGNETNPMWVKTDVGVQLTVEDAISIEADKDTTDGNRVELNAGNSNKGDVKIKVVTNNHLGYNLSLIGSTNGDTINALVGKNTNEKIAAMTATFADPQALSTSASEWGYSVTNANTNKTTANTTALAKFDGSKYAGVSTTTQEIVNVTKPTAAEGDETTVTFAAAVKPDQAADVYIGQVTFTATNNVTVPSGD